MVDASSGRAVAGFRRRPRGAILIAVASLVAAGCAGSDPKGQRSVGADGEAAPATTVARAAKTVASAPPATKANRCVVTVKKGDTMRSLADRGGVTLQQLLKENAIDVKAVIQPGDVFDVCVGNDIDDISQSSRVAPSTADVERQQKELNELFKGTSMLALKIDGDSGRYTRQAACAARMGLGLPVHAGHIVPGSKEEAKIFAAKKLSIPKGAPTGATKWILIDQTCQVIVTGEGDKRIVDIYPTSTGIADFPTHNVQAYAFRFDPALSNNGWHDSTTFPGDNPANGNMYKPIYFNNGQAIHGARFIPPFPKSHGCARTFPQHQDAIIKWLGLRKAKNAIWNADKIGVKVVVRGRYRDLKQVAD